MFHHRKSHKVYKNFPKPAVCPFCDPETIKNKIKETKHAYVIPNRVPYQLWELRKVTEHLMIVPKRHVHSLSELKDSELAEIAQLMGEYEDNNYNIYARASKSKQRSVSHQHTHLIKTEGKQARGSFISRKPYFVIKF